VIATYGDRVNFGVCVRAWEVEVGSGIMTWRRRVQYDVVKKVATAPDVMVEVKVFSQF